MRTPTKFLISIAIFAIFLNASAQPSPTSQAPAKSSTPARISPETVEALTPSSASQNTENSPTEKSNDAVKPSSSNYSDRSALYELLYTNQKEANKDLITIMQWSVGLAATFLLGIAGSQIFFNFRLRKTDIERIRKTNETQIKAEIEKALEKSTELIRAIENNERGARDQLSKFVSGRIDTLDDNIKTLADKISPLEKIPRKLSLVDIRVHDLEGHVWKLRGVESNALTGFIKASELLLKANQPDRVKHRLDEIEEILGESKDIYTRDLDRLEKLLGMLPDAHAEQRDKIVKLYKDLPVFDFIDRKDPNNYDWHYIKNAPQ